eukprot:TRINITY_DN1915_c0_g1_i1.p1 TRINITY_DN1915_c0_g1~~TRINITY_DN1915_c0_g1_i1.p1  ORF type:complete len:141 (-),score=10.05 TRINITY_DN1915_c0_g1_i1:2-424(-)
MFNQMSILQSQYIQVHKVHKQFNPLPLPLNQFIMPRLFNLLPLLLNQFIMPRLFNLLPLLLNQFIMPRVFNLLVVNQFLPVVTLPNKEDQHPVDIQFNKEELQTDIQSNLDHQLVDTQFNQLLQTSGKMQFNQLALSQLF